MQVRPSENDLAVPVHCRPAFLWVDALKEGNEFSVDPVLVDWRRGGVEDSRGGSARHCSKKVGLKVEGILSRVST